MYTSREIISCIESEGSPLMFCSIRVFIKLFSITARWGLVSKSLIVSPDESQGYLGFSTVTPPPQRFPFGRDNLKNILVSPFKFGMWVYMGNGTTAIVL